LYELTYKDGEYVLLKQGSDEFISFSDQAKQELSRSQAIPLLLFTSPLVADIDNSELVYFSANVPDENGQRLESNVHTIVYSYDVRWGELTEIFEQSSDKELHVIGNDNDQLILLALAPDFSPGPCPFAWGFDDANYFSLGLRTRKMYEYTVPFVYRDQEMNYVQHCIEKSSN
jgi:hypothetical protein